MPVIILGHLIHLLPFRNLQKMSHETLHIYTVKLSEAEVHWRDFMESLQACGMCGTAFIVSDDHSGLKAARRAVFGAATRQRCQFHLA